MSVDRRREVFGGRTHADGRDSLAKLRDNDVSPVAFRVRINGVRSKRQTKLFIRSSRLLTAGVRRTITRREAALRGRGTIDVFGVKTIRKRNGQTNGRRREIPTVRVHVRVFRFRTEPLHARFRMCSVLKSCERNENRTRRSGTNKITPAALSKRRWIYLVTLVRQPDESPSNP